MDPGLWRKTIAKLTVRELAAKLGYTRMTAYRYETGEREAPNSAALKYLEISGGLVTGEDLERARKRFRRAQGKKLRAA